MMNREKQKKEQKTFEYIENPEQIEGFDKILQENQVRHVLSWHRQM